MWCGVWSVAGLGRDGAGIVSTLGIVRHCGGRGCCPGTVAGWCGVGVVWCVVGGPGEKCKVGVVVGRDGALKGVVVV